MFLAGLFITVPYSVSNLAFAITGKADRKLPIVMNSFRHLHLSLFRGLHDPANVQQTFPANVFKIQNAAFVRVSLV